MESTQGGAHAEAVPREIAAAWRFLVTGNPSTDDWMAAARRASRRPRAGDPRTRQEHCLTTFRGFPIIDQFHFWRLFRATAKFSSTRRRRRGGADDGRARAGLSVSN